MLASIANYTTPPEVATGEYSLATVFTFPKYRLQSSSLFVRQENQSAPQYRLNGRIFNLLREFQTLQNNWDEDGAVAPDSVAISQARFVTQVLENSGQPVFSAAPGPNGEVMLDMRNSETNRSVETIFYPERSVAVYFPEEGNGIPFQKEFDFAELSKILEWLNQK